MAADPNFDGLAPRLRPLYLLEPGRRLAARGKTLFVMEDDSEVLALPPSRLGRIELGPDTEASLAALDLALANGIEVLRINGRGEVMARYQAEDPDRATRHLAQAKLHLDPVRRGDLARVIVEGRVRNQRALLRRLNRERALPELAAAAVQIGRVLRKLPSRTDVAEIMGMEGEAAKHYWPALGRAAPEDVRFVHRRRRPSPDPVNAVLSLMSSLLARDVGNMARRAGLHVGFGALHSVQDGEEALIYDLVEEFRAPIAEAATLALFNRKALRREMFLIEGDHARLGRAGWAAAIRGYEAWVQRPIRSPRTGKRVLWRGLFLEPAYAYAAHCEGGETYKPYLMDY